MAAIVVGSHGSFSRELIKSAEMICGKQTNIGCATFHAGESVDDLVVKYEEIISKLDCKDGVLFIVDLFGGSPYNAASRIAIKDKNMDIVTGINLPIALELFGMHHFSSVDELVKIALASSAATIKSFKETMKDLKEEDL
ncbi:PTS system D-mannose-specific IIA component, Man family [Anaerovirgula multivorans]|uniref:PTS system D-mannose-specific IIA component, Man family n=1 Tax=Anaerovirgula multivorans TaxID=312168 RepID=A0A239CIH7_9FIRM|nr:mannose/fructose/sorbose PTS transporter subunit IIA [Anaerovirgula multivorans]SNS19264.1 PTS system D-mannose-specific IIA component, Man family [Anaerovirgula multivorans]